MFTDLLFWALLVGLSYQRISINFDDDIPLLFLKVYIHINKNNSFNKGENLPVISS